MLSLSLLFLLVFLLIVQSADAVELEAVSGFTASGEKMTSATKTLVGLSSLAISSNNSIGVNYHLASGLSFSRFTLNRSDPDSDGIVNEFDNCANAANSDQMNFDDDSYGDACDVDIDGDNVPNIIDSDEFNHFVCGDIDGDLCEDCASGSSQVDNDGVDLDNDGLCDIGDLDDDGDQVLDVEDNCEGTINPDQADLDQDGLGDVCDDDVDGDGVTLAELDSDDQNRFVCKDIDDDGCDDCASGFFDNQNDGIDTDSDGICNIGDLDDDGDGIDDVDDNCPLIVNPDQVDSECSIEEGLCIPIKSVNNKVTLICL